MSPLITGSCGFCLPGASLPCLFSITTPSSFSNPSPIHCCLFPDCCGLFVFIFFFCPLGTHSPRSLSASHILGLRNILGFTSPIQGSLNTPPCAAASVSPPPSCWLVDSQQMTFFRTLESPFPYSGLWYLPTQNALAFPSAWLIRSSL